ncbi:unnamed protein product [Adineta steineri]|uniref:DUF4590 domain-containing protein n=2 Tax=Adineta steineri TaxID=433720 RepID=A0A819D763_9BILA|nr:unnamed protein product [Adineta steineri]CAF3830654.1 unnamed protein product [Adineta steineri]
MDLRNHRTAMNSYFNNKNIRQHLITAGLINHHDGILSPRSYEVVLGGRTKPKYTKRRSINSICNYVIEDEQKHHIFIRNVFNPDQHSRNRNSRTFISVSSSSPKRSPLRAKSAHHLPINEKKQVDRRSSIVKQLFDDDNCKVTMIYYGPEFNHNHHKNLYQSDGDEIVIVQQYSDDENCMVYKGCVKPNETFTFESYHHPNHTFTITLYINNFMDSQISVCCEYKYEQNARLDSKHSLFGIYDVQEGKPCRICQFQKEKKTLLTTPSNSSMKENKESSKYEQNHISVITDRYKNNHTTVSFDDKSYESDQEFVDERQNTYENVSRNSLNSSQDSRPSSPLEHEDTHYSSDDSSEVEENHHFLTSSSTVPSSQVTIAKNQVNHSSNTLEASNSTSIPIFSDENSSITVRRHSSSLSSTVFSNEDDESHLSKLSIKRINTKQQPSSSSSTDYKQRNNAKTTVNNVNESEDLQMLHRSIQRQPQQPKTLIPRSLTTQSNSHKRIEQQPQKFTDVLSQGESVFSDDVDQQTKRRVHYPSDET